MKRHLIVLFFISLMLILSACVNSAYGWQLTTDVEDIQKQGSEITQFFDIYENSFK